MRATLEPIPRLGTRARLALLAFAVTVAWLLVPAPAPAAAESITGTVTGPTGALADICVTASGAAASEGTTTAANGTYSIADLPPADDYIVYFEDCASGLHLSEYFNNVTDLAAATPVLVAAGPDTPGIDAQLADDDIPPTTTITDGPEGLTTLTTASFTFGANEPGVTYECSIDTPPVFGPCASPKAYPVADGPHTFAVRATDRAGNIEDPPATRDFTVDSIAPVTTIDTGPSGTVPTANVTFTFSSSKPNSTFICKIDEDSSFPCSSPKGYGGLVNGPHLFTVLATDSSGNSDQTPDTRPFTVDVGGTGDITPPVTIFDSGPAGTITTTSAQLTFHSSESGSDFSCKLDDGAFEPCSSPHSLTGLSDGPHLWRVFAIDSSGNVDPTPENWNFSVDITPPDTTITSGPSSGEITSSSVGFSFESTETGSSFECRVDSEAFASCNSPQGYTGLAVGPHTFEVQATDFTGHLDPSPATGSFTVDISIPPDTESPDTTILTGPSGPIGTGEASFDFESTETESTFQCKLDGDSFTACDSPQAYSALADGPHTFSVRAFDATTNVDPSPATSSFTVDTTLPDTTIASGPSGTISSNAASFTFTSTEPGSSFECKLDAAAFSSCGSPASYSSLAEGSHHFSVRAVDGAANADASPATQSFTVQVPAVEPPPPPPPPTGNPACDQAEVAMGKAESALAKAKAKLKKAKSKGAKKKAKAKVKKAKSTMKAAAASVAESCG